jgi:hypothetical protein
MPIAALIAITSRVSASSSARFARVTGSSSRTRSSARYFELLSAFSKIGGPSLIATTTVLTARLTSRGNAVLLAFRDPADRGARDPVHQAASGLQWGHEQVRVRQRHLHDRELQARQRRLDFRRQVLVLVDAVEQHADQLDHELVDLASPVPRRAHAGASSRSLIIAPRPLLPAAVANAFSRCTSLIDASNPGSIDAN